MLSRFFFLIFIIVIFTLGSLARQPRGLRLSASAGLKDVADSQISPDGKQIVFTISQVSSDHFRTVSRLCPAPMQSREVRRSNQNKANKSLPHRSPDGKLNAFYFDRDKHARHRVISHDGEELRLAAHICQTNIYLAHTGESFTCSPNSKRLAFLSSPKLLADVIRIIGKFSRDDKVSDNYGMSNIPMPVPRPLTWGEIDKLPAEVREMILRPQGQAALSSSSKSNKVPFSLQQNSSTLDNYLSKFLDNPRVITHLQHQSCTSYSGDRRTHVFIVELATGLVQHVTSGNYYEHSINWSSRGNAIVFVSNRESELDKINNTDLDYSRQTG